MVDLGEFNSLFQNGEKLLRKGRKREARDSFLRACRALYVYVKQLENPKEQQCWLDRAARVRKLAEQIEVPPEPSSRSGVLPGTGVPYGSISPNTIAGSPKPSAPTNSSSGPEGQVREAEADSSKWTLSERPDIRFSDIAGLEEVKLLIERRVVYPMRNPGIAKAYKRKVGAGVMMYGPPGTGKTMMAKAIAGELDVPFFNIQSSSILSKWVGEAEQNFRDLFAEARKVAPAVLFFDEAEALLVRRGGDSTVMNRVIPEFLAQVDGVAKGADGLLLLGATNRPWDLDPATIRPGRFGELVYITLPDKPAREFLIRKKLAGIAGGDDIDCSALADRIEGFSGADIDGLIARIVDPVYDRALKTNTVVPVTELDVENGLVGVHPSVSEKELERYEKFGRDGE